MKKTIIEKKIVEIFVVKINNILASVNNRMFDRDEMRKHLSDFYEEVRDSHKIGGKKDVWKKERRNNKGNSW